jgi:hypothetical protein
MDDINNFAVRNHAEVARMLASPEAARRLGKQIAKQIARRDVGISLAGDHPAAQVLLDRFNQGEPVLVRVNGIVQGARVIRHTWNFAPASGVSHYFELAPDSDVSGVPALDLPPLRDDADYGRPVPALDDSRCRYAEVKQCDECTDGARCSRIGQCLRYRCAFGEVDKP